MPAFLGPERGPFQSKESLSSGPLVRGPANCVITRLQIFKPKDIFESGDNARVMNVWFRELMVGSLAGGERVVMAKQAPDSGGGDLVEVTGELFTALQFGADEDVGAVSAQRWANLYMRKLNGIRLGPQQLPMRSTEPEDNGGGDQPLQFMDDVVVTGVRLGKDKIGQDSRGRGRRQHWIDLHWCQILGPA